MAELLSQEFILQQIVMFNIEGFHALPFLYCCDLYRRVEKSRLLKITRWPND